ncbi:prepilin-type N-terminal cleavage/methylation domain-containing protein [Idiomarina sp.]|jgi:prepilin-type N-terminal cleavage/methylation domain-containing protein|uniref:pilin n=1 Tax=Idiomarina sp. TaxID=1874361 RepID=UPI001D5D8565|nr:prepilin-type N-terminal cleavage/methylation domain-containing protein [Idiomarina sp.]MCH2454129.1 prepilin-type N-terminal cleavage/methylation domain-containing protein [Idiomarina sp.]MCJ8316654.1 prepilin-type N-terminal cleavage/methylation domain-containing protein [Idiomarina sp.]NQZ16464.1 prepilin-type N-terminal cleavage/methylation domain-containing protein [Idiomarina sp.]
MQDANTQYNGFSLIEMMVVVAIIAILSAIAVPSYTHYTQQAKVTKALAHAQPFQLSIALCWQTEGQLSDCAQPGQNGLPNVPSPLPDDVASLSIGEDARISLQLASVTIDEQPLSVELTPVPSNTHLEWSIGCSDYQQSRSVVSGCQQGIGE